VLKSRSILPGTVVKTPHCPDIFATSPSRFERLMYMSRIANFGPVFLQMQLNNTGILCVLLEALCFGLQEI